jgi:hypothetical protein
VYHEAQWDIFKEIGVCMENGAGPSSYLAVPGNRVTNGHVACLIKCFGRYRLARRILDDDTGCTVKIGVNVNITGTHVPKFLGRAYFYISLYYRLFNEKFSLLFSIACFIRIHLLKVEEARLGSSTSLLNSSYNEKHL